MYVLKNRNFSTLSRLLPATIYLFLAILKQLSPLAESFSSPLAIQKNIVYLGVRDF